MGTMPKIERQTGVSVKYTEFVKKRICEFIVQMTDEYKRIYEIGNRYPDIALALLGNAFSNAVFENMNVLKIHHVYNAIKNTKNVYDDVKVKELVKFKEFFKDVISDENANLN